MDLGSVQLRQLKVKMCFFHTEKCIAKTFGTTAITVSNINFMKSKKTNLSLNDDMSLLLSVEL